MDPAEYAKLDRLEQRMWWFAAAHANLLMLARDFSPFAAPNRVLDAGCGTGGLLAQRAAHPPPAIRAGSEAAPWARAAAPPQSGGPGGRPSGHHLPLALAASSLLF